MADVRKSGSMKYRLLILSLTIVLVVWIATAVFSYFDATEEFGEMLDAHLAQSATLLAVDVAHDVNGIKSEHMPILDEYSRRVAFQVWGPGQALLLHSANAPEQPFADSDRGFSDVEINGRHWRVFSIRDVSGSNLVQVAELSKDRDEMSRDIANNLFKPLWVSVPLLALLLWVAVTRSLRPLMDLTGEVARRDPDNLARLDSGPAPKEILPLIERINTLFERIEDSLQKERRFTADAAHELRTPVAAIKAQAQVARSATSEAERNHALDNSIAGCDRAAHLIDQLLTLARLDMLDEKMAEPCSLRAIAAEVIALVAPVALGRQVRLELTDGEDAIVRGNPVLLRILLRNLIDNAVHHTGPETMVQIGVVREQEQIRLSVTDNGPGIPESELDRVMERFYRPLGTRGAGSGLGLSIVKRIADIHSATLRLSLGKAGGLVVSVNFRS